jgi:hypothetical protein
MKYCRMLKNQYVQRFDAAVPQKEMYGKTTGLLPNND